MSKTRLIIASVLLLLTFVVNKWVRSGYEHAIRPLSAPLTDLPREFGAWSGVDEAPLDERIAGVLGADETIGRQYRNSHGESIHLHIACWSSPQQIPDPAPHHPQQCYTGSGWEVLDQKVLTFETGASDEPLRVELLQYQKNNEMVISAHWFQIGSRVILNRNEGRKVYQSLWGHKEWPSTVKVLMQVNQSSIAEAEKLLETFVPRVAAFTASLDEAEEETGTPK